jgi:hypothetical protein
MRAPESRRGPRNRRAAGVEASPSHWSPRSSERMRRARSRSASLFHPRTWPRPSRAPPREAEGPASQRLPLTSNRSLTGGGPSRQAHQHGVDLVLRARAYPDSWLRRWRRRRITQVARSGSQPHRARFRRRQLHAGTGVTPSISDTAATFAIDKATDVLDWTYTNRARGAIKGREDHRRRKRAIRLHVEHAHAVAVHADHHGGPARAPIRFRGDAHAGAWPEALSLRSRWISRLRRGPD